MSARPRFEVGDRVAVRDEGLAQLTAIAKAGGFEPKVPNNVGVIDDIKDDTAYVIFDDCGQCAPYPLTDCFRINPHVIPPETASDAQQYDGKVSPS